MSANVGDIKESFLLTAVEADNAQPPLADMRERSSTIAETCAAITEALGTLTTGLAVLQEAAPGIVASRAAARDALSKSYHAAEVAADAPESNAFTVLVSAHNTFVNFQSNTMGVHWNTDWIDGAQGAAAQMTEEVKALAARHAPETEIPEAINAASTGAKETKEQALAWVEVH